LGIVADGIDELSTTIFPTLTGCQFFSIPPTSSRVTAIKPEIPLDTSIRILLLPECCAIGHFADLSTWPDTVAVKELFEQCVKQWYERLITRSSV
jgi:hypothetical protein